MLRFLIVTGCWLGLAGPVWPQPDPAVQELNTLDGRLDSVKSVVRQSASGPNDELEDLQNEIAKLTDELTELYALPTDKIKENEHRISDLKDRLTELEARVQNFSAEVNDLRLRQEAPDGEETVREETPFPPPEHREPEPDYYPEPESEPGSGTVEEYLWDTEPARLAEPVPEAAADTTPAGPLVRQVMIIGNDRTDRQLIARSIEIKGGATYDTNRVRLSMLRLDKLQAFYHARFTLVQDSTSDSLMAFLRVSDICGPGANPVDFLIDKGREVTDGRFTLSWYNLFEKGRILTVGTEWEWWHWDKKQSIRLAYRIPYFITLPLWTDLYLFDHKETWYTGMFFEDEVTILKYGGGLTGYHLVNLWLEGKVGLEYYQRTFNRTYADGDILSLGTEWFFTTRRLRSREAMNYRAKILLDYNMFHRMGRFDDLAHFGKVQAGGGLSAGLTTRLLLLEDIAAGICTHDIPVDRQFCMGTEQVMRGHPKRAKLGTVEAYSTTELQVRIVDALAMALFADIGNIWPQFESVDPWDWRKDIGAAAIITLPLVGTFRVDYAVNVDDIIENSEMTWNIYLNSYAF